MSPFRDTNLRFLVFSLDNLVRFWWIWAASRLLSTCGGSVWFSMWFLLPLFHTQRHAHQRHDRKREGNSPCNTSVHNTSETLKKLQNKCFRLKEEQKHVSSNQQSNKRRNEVFSHYLVSVKNRNSPVTFTLHFWLYTVMYMDFSLIIVLNVFINSL